MSRLLRNYIKLLVESASDNEGKYIDIIAAKNQEKQNQKFYGDELNHIIFELNKVSDIDDITSTLKQNGYSLIGQGAFRDVYSRKDVDFVIKLSSDYQDSSNQFEYNIYFDNDQYEDVNSINTDEKYYDVSIFPKLYGYDKNYGQWIIFEKVKTINDNHISIEKFFPLFFQQIKSLCDIIYEELNIDIYSSLSYENKHEIFRYIIDFLRQIYNKKGNYDYMSNEYDRYHMLFSILNIMCYKNRQLLNYPKSNLMSVLTKRKFNISITKDIMYFMNAIRDKNAIEDLNYGNIGYRDIKNSAKPWESFVIIDYAL